MDAGILQALKTVKNNTYVQYVGLGLAALVTQQEQCDPITGAPLRKSKLQMVRISAAVCGIELCYAAETAFVSPILLKLGVPTSLMTLTWCLSPMLGFFLVPVMGSLSDRCGFKFGRRRPFIILMSVGIILGLALVPNGETLGILLGDHGNETVNSLAGSVSARLGLNLTESMNSTTSSLTSIPSEHFRGIIFTILGVALLDFNCDACQSPCRAYLLDVSVPDDHSTGLTTFTVMAGAGGSIGYIMGSIDWNSTHFGEALGGHIRVVFSIVLVAFIVCIISTLTSFREIPLSQMGITANELQVKKTKVGSSKYEKFTNENSPTEEGGPSEGLNLEKSMNGPFYGALSRTNESTPYGAVSNGLNSLGGFLTQTDTISSKENSKSRNAEEWPNVGAAKRKLYNNSSFSESSNSNNRVIKLQNGKLANSCLQQEDDHMTKQEVVAGFLQTSDQPEQQNNRSSSFSVRPRTKFLINVDNKIPKGQNTTFLHGEKVTEDNDVSDEINPYAKYSHDVDNNCTKECTDAVRKVEVSTDVALKTYLRSIVKMPRSMWVLCLCNLLCWMSLVCYSLYFTDFVGQSVYGGDPHAPVGSDLHNKYDDGVRLGSLGMSLYSLACACYSLTIERLVQRFRAKRVYMLGQLVFTVGMVGMAVSRSKVAVILLSPTAGIMYATLFTMPYLLVAHYHTRGLFSQGATSLEEPKQIRGLGTDVAIISSMVFLAQFLLSLMIGTLVVAMGSPVIVILASCVLSLLGSLTAKWHRDIKFGSLEACVKMIGFISSNGVFLLTTDRVMEFIK